MVKPSGQTAALVAGRAASEPLRPPRTDGAGTRARILEAAFRRLAREGYARLSMREIAADLGINHGLINYHFRTKDNLVLAVLDEANGRLLARQEAMYKAELTVREKWDRACRFYEDDLESGFVRLMMELFAASFSDAQLREQFRPRYLAWRRMVDAAVRDALAAYDLAPGVPAEAIGAWIGAFWTGMELEMMLDIDEREGHHRAALDAMRRFLANLESRANDYGKRAGRPGTARGSTQGGATDERPGSRRRRG